MTYEAFLADTKTQDAVIRNLEIIGEAPKNLSTELRTRYPDVPWKGMASEKDGTCCIGRFIVHPEKQNQGIGTALMNEIERCFNGVQRYELFTGSESTKNIQLYEKLGYHIFKSEKPSEVVELVYMEKKL